MVQYQSGGVEKWKPGGRRSYLVAVGKNRDRAQLKTETRGDR